MDMVRNKRIDAPSITQRSKRRNSGSTGMGPTRLAMPMMASRLNMFDPITLPSATSACRLSAAMTVVASSGSEVPTATSVRPITVSLMP